MAAKLYTQIQVVRVSDTGWSNFDRGHHLEEHLLIKTAFASAANSTGGWTDSSWLPACSLHTLHYITNFLTWPQ